MIRKGLLGSGAAFLIAAAFSLWGWIATPEGAQIPVHFNASGEPDRYGSRFEGFLLMPLIILAMTALFAVLPRLDPRGSNLQRSAAAYLTAWIGVAMILAGTQGFLSWSATGGLAEAGAGGLMIRGACAMMSLLFLLLGNVLGKARPNFFLGVRTPWTLTSDITWEKTHRMTGRLWVSSGVIGLVLAAFAPPEVAIYAVLAMTVGAALFALVYSWLVWRTAPDRRPGPQAEQ